MRRRLKKFFTLPFSEKYRVIQAAILVVMFRMGLWLIPYRILRRFANVRRKSLQAGTDNIKIQDQIAKEVAAVAHYFPQATCLTQALSAHVLLRRRGFDPVLQLGVARNDEGKFLAHAWIECDGRIVIGGASSGFSYTTFQAAGLPLRDADRESDSGPYLPNSRSGRST